MLNGLSIGKFFRVSKNLSPESCTSPPEADKSSTKIGGQVGGFHMQGSGIRTLLGYKLFDFLGQRVQIEGFLDEPIAAVFQI
jgi:hypothetical protein